MNSPRYPKATWLGNGKSGGTWTGGPYKVVLHTTETEGLPDFAGGYTAPHLTYDPETRKWWQHTELTHAGRALRNETGGVQTNRDCALQVEIVCYSAKNIADQAPARRQWVGELFPDQLRDIREFLDWSHTEYGVMLDWPGRQALSYSEANAPGFRMSPASWDDYDGVCGHQHVPENVHWDPGALAWGALFPEEENMPDPMLTKALQLAMREAGIPGKDGQPIEPDGVLGANTKYGLKLWAKRAEQGHELYKELRQFFEEEPADALDE